MKKTPEQMRALHPLIDSNPRALEYHVARIARSPSVAADAAVTLSITPALMAFNGICRIVELASKAVRRLPMMDK